MDNTIRRTVVLDSCVFNKLFLIEDDRQQALDLLSYLEENDYLILAPTLFLYEVLSVIQTNEYPTEKAYEIIKLYQDVNLKLIDLDDRMIKYSIEIANQGHEKSGYPSFYDSTYHALAMIHDCQFITADQKHEAKTRYLGNIILLRNWDAIKN